MFWTSVWRADSSAFKPACFFSVAVLRALNLASSSSNSACLLVMVITFSESANCAHADRKDRERDSKKLFAIAPKPMLF